MDLHRIIPGIDVSFVSTGIGQVFCGTQKDPWHMHEFAKGEIRKEKSNKKEMDIEKEMDTLGWDRLKMEHA